MRVHTHRIKVQFSDCDPAGIVFFANFFRMFEECFDELLEAAGIPMATMRPRFGSVGFPLLEAGAKFKASASFGDVLEITTRIVSQERKTVHVAHLFRRGDDVILEGREVRVWARPHPDDPGRIKATAIPPEVSAALAED